MHESDIEEFLETCAKEVPFPIKGDIAVFRYKGEIEHTAIVFDEHKMLHKPGAKRLCIESNEAVRKTYHTAPEITYRRKV